LASFLIVEYLTSAPFSALDIVEGETPERAHNSRVDNLKIFRENFS